MKMPLHLSEPKQLFVRVGRGLFHTLQLCFKNIAHNGEKVFGHVQRQVFFFFPLVRGVWRRGVRCWLCASSASCGFTHNNLACAQL